MGIPEHDSAWHYLALFPYIVITIDYVNRHYKGHDDAIFGLTFTFLFACTIFTSLVGNQSKHH